MSNQAGKEINIDKSTIEANRDANIIGRDQNYMIDLRKYEVKVAPPSSDANEEQLLRSLKQNRTALLKNEKKLEELIAQGIGNEDDDVGAAVMNAMIAMDNIHLLIKALMLRGNDVEFKPGETNRVKRWNAVISRGIVRLEEKKQKLEREKKQKEREEDLKAFLIFIAIVAGIIIFVLLYTYI